MTEGKRTSIWMEKGPLRHSETMSHGGGIEEVAKAIEEKRRCNKIWHKTKTANDLNNYKKCCFCSGKYKARAG